MAVVQRREFLATTGALALAAAGPAPAQPGRVPLPGKDPRLSPLSTKPLVLETPDALLRANRITPTAALFVRNHHGAGAFVDMRPRPLDGALLFAGQGRRPRSLPLAAMAGLEQVEVEMVLQCSGNGRKQFGRLAPIKGTPWTKGGIGNVRFRGVPLAAAVAAAGLEVGDAQFATLEGADQPERDDQIDYERSVPLIDAMARGLLATELNGQPLPAVHGGPVRFVLPGFYGANHVKWLTRVRFEAAESANHFQASDYRTPLTPIQPGERFEPTPRNSESNFHMRLASRILSHADGAAVRPGPLTARGVAWNDGRAPITTVELSADRGQSWRATKLAPAAGPFAWREWSAAVTLPPGPAELWCRAADAWGRSQPAEGGVFWNPGGYAWNGVDKVSLTVA